MTAKERVLARRAVSFVGNGALALSLLLLGEGLSVVVGLSELDLRTVLVACWVASALVLWALPWSMELRVSVDGWRVLFRTSLGWKVYSRVLPEVCRVSVEGPRLLALRDRDGRQVLRLDYLEEADMAMDMREIGRCIEGGEARATDMRDPGEGS